MARTTTTNRLLVRDFGTALNYNAVSDRVSNTDPVTDFDTASTVALWLKTGSDITTSARIVGVASANSSKVLGANLNAGILRGGYFNGSVYVSPKSLLGITRSTWYHIVVVWNGTTSSMYVNGVAATTTGNNPGLGQAVGVYAGSTTSGLARNFVVDDVMVWTRALSATEAAEVYKTGTTDSTSLWLYWKFNEGSGTVATDISGNGRNGTLTNLDYTTDVRVKPRTVIS